MSNSENIPPYLLPGDDYDHGYYHDLINRADLQLIAQVNLAGSMAANNSPEQEQSKLECPRCDKMSATRARFCRYCGYQLKQGPPAPPKPSPASQGPGLIEQECPKDPELARRFNKRVAFARKCPRLRTGLDIDAEHIQEVERIMREFSAMRIEQPWEEPALPQFSDLLRDSVDDDPIDLDQQSKGDRLAAFQAEQAAFNAELERKTKEAHSDKKDSPNDN